MLRSEYGSFNPFLNYANSKVTTYGNVHYLRKYDHVLWVVTDLEKDTFTAKRRVFREGRIYEYQMEEDDIQEFQKLLQSSEDIQKKREEKIQQIRSPLIGTQPIDFESHEAVAVIQHEYATAKADSDQPVLGSFGAGPCVILALYDSDNKTAVLAHIDLLTDINSLQQLFTWGCKLKCDMMSLM